ncbi:hypothetical protein POKO110462_12745 [Pontibacter korlensis]|uniref:Uncharacterized protein n=1 Tax=Pontibacter korlensis TaxID=400092 RepID=A0A0E3ZJ25_9BACT|nr:hypothetical protein [Pontibacter korlensis]AKD05724.1 hypothetical protein PKOR_13950 [Pontibacter korlensis]
MADNNKSNELKTHAGEGGNVSGRPEGRDTGPVAGGADNTRGENKPSREGNSAGAKAGKDTPNQNSPQGSNQNPTTTTRGADSTDKEFRNNQPNASTLKGHKSNEGLGNEKD